MKSKTERCNCSDKQGWFHLALQSSTAALSMHRVLGIAAVHLCWVAAVLYDVQKPIGVIAGTIKAVSLIALQSRTVAEIMHKVLALLLCICAGLLQSCMQFKTP